MSSRQELKSRVDKNQPQLTEKFRSLGATVILTHAVGKGFVDAVVGINGYTALVEYKYEKGKLTPAQVEFHSTWAGLVWIARTEEDVEKIVKFYSDLVPLVNKQTPSHDLASQDVS